MASDTFYEPGQIEEILDRVFKLIRDNKPHEADAILSEFDLHSFVCGSA